MSPYIGFHCQFRCMEEGYIFQTQGRKQYFNGGELMHEARLKTNKLPPFLIGKGVWACFEEKDFLYSIKRGHNKKGDRKAQTKKAAADARQDIADMYDEDYNKFSAVWMDKSGHLDGHWSCKAVQHSCFSATVSLVQIIK